MPCGNAQRGLSPPPFAGSDAVPKAASVDSKTISEFFLQVKLNDGVAAYREGVKVCQKAGYTRRSRCKQISKRKRENAFRAHSGLKRAVVCLSVPWHTL